MDGLTAGSRASTRRTAYAIPTNKWRRIVLLLKGRQEADRVHGSVKCIARREDNSHYPKSYGQTYHPTQKSQRSELAEWRASEEGE